MKSAPVLMTPDNPTGWKLEDLVAQLKVEILAKCDRIKDDSRPQAMRVMLNNASIIALLDKIRVIQRGSLALLDQLGPDNGPLGAPRIGKGSIGGPS